MIVAESEAPLPLPSSFSSLLSLSMRAAARPSGSQLTRVTRLSTADPATHAVVLASATTVALPPLRSPFSLSPAGAASFMKLFLPSVPSSSLSLIFNNQSFTEKASRIVSKDPSGFERLAIDIPQLLPRDIYFCCDGGEMACSWKVYLTKNEQVVPSIYVALRRIPVATDHPRGGVLLLLLRRRFDLASPRIPRSRQSRPCARRRRAARVVA